MRSKRDYTIWPQIYASATVCICGMCAGTFFAFSSVAIPLLKKTEEGDVGISSNEGSWIVSLFYIGTVLGSLVAGTMNDRIGAKKMCLIMAPTVIFNWALTALSTDLNTLLASRVISGMCYGIFLALVKVYNAEISHPDLRGTTSAFYPTFLSGGLLYGFILGYVFKDVRLISVFLSFPAVLYLVMSLFIPDSPYWLVQKGHFEEARQALQWLRGSSCDISAEFGDIIAKRQLREAMNPGWKHHLTSPDFLKPMLKVGTIMALVELGGPNLLSQYMVTIFEESGSSVDPTLAPIFVSSTRMILGCFSAILLRFCPRRKLVLVALFLVMGSFCSLGAFSFNKQQHSDVILNKQESRNLAVFGFDLDQAILDHDEAVLIHDAFVEAYGWIPMLSVMVVQVCETVALVPVLHLALPAESFPTDVRAIGCGFCGIVIAFTRFCILKTFPVLIDVCYFHTVIWGFAGVIFVLQVFVYFVVPENKGQSLVQTEDKMSKHTSTLVAHHTLL
ncbi:facilitated trehalose transporter Tret1-like [Tigriopus californicus]|uniref:facilitated trehalose transporter Tret1-like n=1 Tax=Tigriopus californicus TaxID=6832 RepID=UPI0027DA065A|nr:facilitated trehalose transporter Tret1-like [Tigriopus californicus]